MRYLIYTVLGSIVFIGALFFWHIILKDDHREPVTDEDGYQLFVVIAQTGKGPVSLWGRTELAEFLASNKDARFLIQPEEKEGVWKYFAYPAKKEEKPLGVFADKIIDGRQLVRVTIEEGPGLYSFAYEATANGIKPLERTRFTIYDVLKPFVLSVLTTLIIGALYRFVDRARRKRRQGAC